MELCHLNYKNECNVGIVGLVGLELYLAKGPTFDWQTAGYINDTSKNMIETVDNYFRKLASLAMSIFLVVA